MDESMTKELENARWEFYKNKTSGVSAEKRKEIETDVLEYWRGIKSKEMLILREKIKKLPPVAGNKILIIGKS